MNPWKSIWIITRHELADSIRSKRVVVLLLLYLAGSMAATWIFVYALQQIERQLVESMGLATIDTTGSVTAVLWKSDAFRHMLTSLVGDPKLAASLLAIPPLALFYGWLSFAFAPALVMLSSSARISEEIWTGSVRFVSFRTSRLHWCIGKFAGQAAQLFLALVLSAVGAWIVGRLRMNSFQPWMTAEAMFIFSAKAWVYSLAFLGLATGISQLCASPNIAIVLGFMAMIAFTILHAVSDFFAGDGIARSWDIVNMLIPGGHKMNLWWGDPSHLLPALVFLPALGLGYLLLGHVFFRRRDL